MTVVVSTFAPRYEKWPGTDYDDLLRVLQASCDRLGVRHVCISDSYRPHCDTFVCDLPQALMPLLIDAQLQFMRQCDEPILFTGADCILTRNPDGVLKPGIDLAITTDASHRRLNTGAMFVADGPRCAPVWQAALDMGPDEWGTDQTCLLAAIQASDLAVDHLPKSKYNRPPLAEGETGEEAMIVHFKGERKKQMRPWWERYAGKAQAVSLATRYTLAA